MEAPSFDEVVKQAIQGLDNEEVRIFYLYFEDLKQHVGRNLGGKARTNPGESAIAQSALLSMFCDLAMQNIPLSEVDDYGYPMLWPLALSYIERHCDKWNQYYRAKKRRGLEVPIGATTGENKDGLDPADPRSAEWDESQVESCCRELNAKLTDEERAVFDLWAAGKTLDDTAAILQKQGFKCSVAKVSYVRKRIREKLLTL